MDHANRVAQLYGYTVCLVAVVTVLIALPNLIDNVFKLSDPLRSDGIYEPILSSFDAYQATWERGRGFTVQEGTPSVAPPSEADLRQRYEALRVDRIATKRFEASRSLVTSTLVLLVALGLFVAHWRWLRRKDGDDSTVVSSQKNP
jgi:hypothetical protein